MQRPLLLAGLMALAANAVPGEEIKVMSFNLRYASARDGKNAWEKRRELVFEVIRKHDPDLLGTQETEFDQGVELGRELSGYTRVGVCRDDGDRKGESAMLYYRTSRFEQEAGGTFWLSETPEVPGKKGWDAACPRVATWVRLKDRAADGRALVFINTHFDHMGAKARTESARMLRAWIETNAQGLPVVLTGDFNCEEASEPYRLLLGKADGDAALSDLYRKVHPERTPEEATYHGFAGKRAGSRIDWILATADCVPVDSTIDATNQEGRYPSDHFPVAATVRIPHPTPERSTP